MATAGKMWVDTKMWIKGTGYKNVRVLVSIDVNYQAVAATLAHKAAQNKSKKQRNAAGRSKLRRTRL